MKVLTLVPAYGRNPSSEEKAIDDWNSGKDWQILDISSVFNGAYCSIRDADMMKSDGFTNVSLRFEGLSKTVIVEI